MESPCSSYGTREHCGRSILRSFSMHLRWMVLHSRVPHVSVVASLGAERFGSATTPPIAVDNIILLCHALWATPLGTKLSARSWRFCLSASSVVEVQRFSRGVYHWRWSTVVGTSFWQSIVQTCSFLQAEGLPQHLINHITSVAEEVRGLTENMGFGAMGDLIGHAEVPWEESAIGGGPLLLSHAHHLSDAGKPGKAEKPKLHGQVPCMVLHKIVDRTLVRGFKMTFCHVESALSEYKHLCNSERSSGTLLSHAVYGCVL